MKILYGCCFTAELFEGRVLPGIEIDYVDIIPNLHKNNGRYLCCSIEDINFKDYDFIFCSPPCNYWSRANYRRNVSPYSLNTKHLLPLCIKKSIDSGKPFVIENVRNYNMFKCNGLLDMCYFFFTHRHTFFTNLIIPYNPLWDNEKCNIQNRCQSHRQGGYSTNIVFNDIFYYYFGGDINA